MKVIFTLLFLASVNMAISQAPGIQWQKTMGGSNVDATTAVIQTNDGGYFILGHTKSIDGDISGNHGGVDIWMIKLDIDGGLEWQKTIGGSGDDHSSYTTQQTTDGGFIICGWTTSTNGDITSNHGGYDLWVVKLTDKGAITWQKTFGGSSNDYAMAIQQTTDGGYIVVSEAYSHDGDVVGNHGDYDYFVLKLDSNGGVEWKKTYGGTGNDMPWSVVQTSDGGYIMAGQSTSADGDVTGNHGNNDYWILKLDNSGGVDWQKSYGGSKSDTAHSIYQTTDGGYLISGYSRSTDGDITDNKGDDDIWLLKLDNLGNIEIQKSLGGTSNDGFGHGALQTKDGGFLTGGWSYSNDGDLTDNKGSADCWLVKLDQNAEIRWQKNMGGTNFDEIGCMKQTSDNGYIVVGYTLSDNGDITSYKGGGDAWIVKLLPEPIFPLQLLLFSAKPTESAVLLNWQTSELRATINFIIERSKDGEHFSSLQQVAAIGNGNQKYAATDSKPYGGISYYRLKMADADGKVSYSKMATVNFSQMGVLSVYPNPVKDMLNVQWQSSSQGKTILAIMDISGKKILEKTLDFNENENQTLSTKQLPAGTYLLQISNGGNKQSIQFIKE